MQIEIDKITLAKTLYGEARGSTDLDRFAVACVIRNRAKIAQAYFERHQKPHPLFGDGTLHKACLKPFQFSCWNKNDPNYKILNQLDPDHALISNKAFIKCYEIAEQIISEFDFLRDITEGATHFHTRNMGWPAAWGKQKPHTIEIGAHLYYNNLH